MTGTQATSTEALRPYLPRLLVQWLAAEPELRGRELDATLVFVDVSGFTAMSERLARLGKVGAEEVTDVVGGVFARLLAVAYGNGGGLVKFGGDALLLLFDGPAHEVRGARAAAGMRQALREIGPIPTSAGPVRLRMSVGIHSGSLLLALVGDSHRELVLTGPAATRTVVMEQTAAAGEIVVSPTTAAALPAAALGERRDDGLLLRRAPAGFDPAPAEEPVPAGVDVRQCIPFALREHLLAGLDDPEHRPVTTAFLRFAGVDDLAASGGTAAVVDALDELVAAVQRAADARGVTFLGSDVDRDGGKIVLVAGAPRALGGDEERLLRVLREIVEAPLPLPVRVGVNRGHVFAGDVGPPYRRTYTVMGDAVNLAARLMARAAPGTVLATPEVLSACATAFAADAVDPFTVKGKREPVVAVVVGAPLGVRASALAELPLVGRREEVDALAAAVDALRAGRGGAVEIVGPPGIGKSRLLGELLARAEGLRLLAAACDPYSVSSAYRPVAVLLREALGVRPGASRASVARRLRERVRAAAPELAPWLPLLGVPLDLELAATPEVADLGEEFRRARLEAVTVELLARLLPGPAVLAIEDVHWLDEASSSLLERIASELESLSWLVCLTRRDEPGGFALPVGGKRVTTLRPSPLAGDDARTLVIAASEHEPLRPDQVRALVERAGGNPLFVQELVRGVHRAGGVDGLPDSLEAMTMAEIDRLAPSDRRVLRRASVLGLRFEDSLLTTLFEPDEWPGPAVWSRLAEFVLEEEPGQRRFRHALVRDAAYEGLAFRRRQELHALAAEAIEAAAADPDDEAELLSLHFLHAGRGEQAWRYARLAGDRAAAKYASSEAATLYRRALDAAGRESGIPTNEVAEALESLGGVARKIGAFDEAAVAYREAERRLRSDPVRAARLVRKRADISEHAGRYPEQLRLLRGALRRLEGVEGATAAGVRAELATRYAAGRARQGRHAEAARWCDRAIGEGEASRNRRALAWAYLVLDGIDTERGGAEDGDYGRRALAIFEELGELTPVAHLLSNLGARAYYAGGWREAASLYERARELWVRIGNADGEATIAFNLGELLSHQGRLDEAELRLEEARRFWRAAGDHVGAALATSELGRLAVRHGDAVAALELLGEARAVLEAAGADLDVLETDVRSCEALLVAGDAAAALPLAERLLARAREGGEVADLRVYRLLRLRGEALLASGRADEAGAALVDALAGARAAGARYEQALALRALDRLDHSVPSGADEPLEAQARAILDELGAL